jgi:hypothetical protein
MLVLGVCAATFIPVSNKLALQFVSSGSEKKLAAESPSRSMAAHGPSFIRNSAKSGLPFPIRAGDILLLPQVPLAIKRKIS